MDVWLEWLWWCSHQPPIDQENISFYRKLKRPEFNHSKVLKNSTLSSYLSMEWWMDVWLMNRCIYSLSWKCVLCVECKFLHGLFKEKGGGVGGGNYWQKQQGIKMVGCAVGLHMCEKCGGDGAGCVARLCVVVHQQQPPIDQKARVYKKIQKARI